MKTTHLFLLNVVAMLTILSFALIPIGEAHAYDNDKEKQKQDRPRVEAHDDAIVGTWRVTMCAPGTSVKKCENAQASTSGEFLPILGYVTFNKGQTMTADFDIAEDHTGHGIWKQLRGNRIAFMFEFWEYLPPLGDDARADEAERVRATIALNKKGTRFRGSLSFDELDRNRDKPVTTFTEVVIVGNRMTLIRQNVFFP